MGTLVHIAVAIVFVVVTVVVMVGITDLSAILIKEEDPW